MIYNERQYKVTRSAMQDLLSAIAEIPDSDDWIDQLEKDALKSQISDLECEIREYEMLKEGVHSFQECSNLSELPKALICARISKNLSQRELAEALGMSSQQIQRYEATSYAGASLSKLISISDILEVRVQETWTGSKVSTGDVIYHWDNIEGIDWSKFPIKEMIKRGWVSLVDKLSPIESVRGFFVESMGDSMPLAYHRKKFHGGKRPKEYSLLAWQAKVLSTAEKTRNDRNVGEFVFDSSWVPELVSLSNFKDGPIFAKKLLEEKGIILVYEKHLEGTYLDGAAMKLESGNPVIGITLRYDRLDHFWFVLMHELGHVFLHLYTSIGLDFFDEEGEGELDEFEKEADDFALQSLISFENWEKAVSRFMPSEKAVKADAKRFGVGEAIVAGRIRKEKHNYTILNELVGQGTVRDLLK